MPTAAETQKVTPDLPENVDKLREDAGKRFHARRKKQTVKKYLLGAAGAAAVVLGTNGSAVSNAPAAATPTSFAADGLYEIKNHERWPIKTSVTTEPALLVPVSVDLREFASFPPESGSVHQFDHTFIPNEAKPGLREGQIVSTEGYIHLVAFEKTDDSDYHIQINDRPTNDPRDLTPCLIVEVPHPAAAATPELALEFAAVRKFLRDSCFNGATPKGTVATPIHVRVTGQLFYDLSHHASPGKPGGGRGKAVDGHPMPATTIWEIHPITNIEPLPE